MYYLKKSISRFVLFGLFNTILSNLLLLLLLKIFPLSVSAFFAQIFHAITAYFFGKVKIFKKYGSPLKFFILVIFSWTLQWQLIKILKEIGFDNLYAILIVIPLLALISYLIQKIFIFK
tara:strand:+ start:299 stop:655 length:357 start_codon:yes stop_codon:yes gene_type:complete